MLPWSEVSQLWDSFHSDYFPVAVALLPGGGPHDQPKPCLHKQLGPAVMS